MSTQPDHPYLAFAGRYADPTQDYLNAFIALARCEALLEDLVRVSEMLDKYDPPERRWAPWFGAEIISYYGVGFVTCLEWHAKSRLIDILTFNPKALRTDDLKGVLSDKLTVQMIAVAAPITHLIGASVRVTSSERYYGIIKRVLHDLGVTLNLGDWLTGQIEGATMCWMRPDQMHLVEELFEFRHELVHEVGSSTIGHWNIRNSWSPSEALHYGRVALSLMAGVEAAITRFAPASFPNLLTEEGWPIASVDQRKSELAALRAATDSEIRKAEWQSEGTLEAWEALQTAGDRFFEAEERFIERAEMLHWRYFDARAPLRDRSLQYRIGFLKDLLSNFVDLEEGDNARG